MTGRVQVGMRDGREGNKKKEKWKGSRSRKCVEIVGGVVSGFS